LILTADPTPWPTYRPTAETRLPIDISYHQFSSSMADIKTDMTMPTSGPTPQALKSRPTTGQPIMPWLKLELTQMQTTAEHPTAWWPKMKINMVPKTDPTPWPTS